MRWNYARPALFLGFPLPPDNRTKVPSSAPRNCGKRFSPRQVFRRNLSSGWLCDELNKKKRLDSHSRPNLALKSEILVSLSLSPSPSRVYEIHFSFFHYFASRIRWRTARRHRGPSIHCSFSLQPKSCAKFLSRPMNSPCWHRVMSDVSCANRSHFCFIYFFPMLQWILSFGIWKLSAVFTCFLWVALWVTDCWGNSSSRLSSDSLSATKVSREKCKMEKSWVSRRTSTPCGDLSR